MKNNVLIEMINVQITLDERTETKLITEGTFEEKAFGYVIAYEDSEATGFVGSVTRIAVMKNRATASIRRMGTSNTSLMLEKDKKHYCYYSTPYGDMRIGVHTNAIESQLDETGGNLVLKYTIDMNSAYMSENEIYMTIKPL